MDSSGVQPMQGSAGRDVLNFAGNNVLATVHTQENVKLVQHQQAAKASSGSHEGGITRAGATMPKRKKSKSLRRSSTSWWLAAVSCAR